MTEWLLPMALALLLAVLVLLIVLLVRQSRDRQDLMQDSRDQLQQLLNLLDEGQDAQVQRLTDISGQTNAGLNAMAQNLYQSLTNMQTLLSAESRAQQRSLTDGAKTNADQVELLRTVVQTQLRDMRDSNDRQLTAMRQTVDEKLTETLGQRLDSSFAQVSARLEAVSKGLGEMQTLAVGVGDLKKVLTNVKTRGIWGEMQLGALMAELLSSAQYETNVAVEPNAKERVEFALRLPGSDGLTVYLPVDSKFPQEDYTRLIAAGEAGDADALNEARKALAQSLMTEAKRIADKYIRPPYTTDFAVMFLPVEGLYAEAMRDMALPDAIQRRHRVVLAGPSTFAALLNALQMGFRTLAIQQRTGEVWQLLRGVRTEFDRFETLLNKAQNQLNQAGETLNQVQSRTAKLSRKLTGVEQTDPDGMDAAAEQIRLTDAEDGLQ